MALYQEKIHKMASLVNMANRYSARRPLSSALNVNFYPEEEYLYRKNYLHLYIKYTYRARDNSCTANASRNPSISLVILLISVNYYFFLQYIINSHLQLIFEAFVIIHFYKPFLIVVTILNIQVLPGL